MASVKCFEEPKASVRGVSQLKHLHQARILIRYRKAVVEMVEGTSFIENLMQVLKYNEWEYIQNTEFDEEKALAGLFVVIRHLELGFSMAFNILLDILRNVSPKTAKILADSAHKPGKFTTDHLISTLKEVSFTLMVELSIKGISNHLKGIFSAPILSDIPSKKQERPRCLNSFQR